MLIIIYLHHMRTIVEIPDRYVQQLDELKAVRGVSRTELVREAVEQYLRSAAATTTDDAFGLWAKRADRGEEGVTYQRRQRAEWDA
jgi:predicted transcriptional regulator